MTHSSWDEEFSHLLYRPLSATARLATQSQEGKRDPNIDRPQTVAEIRNRPMSRRVRTSTARSHNVLKHVIGDPKFHNRERRLSLTDTTGVGQIGDILKRLNISKIERDLNQKIEEGISLDQLQEIKFAFEHGGESGLSLDDFKEVFGTVLGINNVDKQIERLFMKIDTSSDGFIDWDEFCSYMQLEYAEKEAVSRRASKVKFNIPAIQSSAVHRDEVNRISNIGDSGLMTVSQDGTLCFWKGTQLTLEKSIRLGHAEDRRPSKSTWVTDCVVISSLNRVFAFTGDREILVYDSISLELYCRITGMDSVPLRVSHHSDDFKVILVMGDEKGSISLLVIRRLGDTLREWKNNTKSDKSTPTVSIHDAAKHANVSYYRWKAHNDWITEIMFIKQLNAVISTSNHPATAICISPMPDVGDHFSMVGSRASSANRNNLENFKPSLNYIQVSKGVKTCAYTSRGNLLATGGIDRVVRLINIPSRTFSITKASGFLKGHNAPVTYVGIEGKENRLISTSQDNVIRVWDVSEQTCLLTLNPKTHQIRGDFSAVFFSPSLKCIAVATDVINLLQMKVSSSSKKVNLHGTTLALSHPSPITSCGYNHTFSQVVTSDETGLIRVWDLESNRKTFEFATKVPVSCINFDNTHRRLIVGCRDGTARIYNHNNGGLLKMLKPKKLGREVSVVMQINIGQSEFFMSLGWERRINLFPETDRKHVLEQRCLSYWDDDISKGHKEDIIAACCLNGNLLASASFDGEIIIWNMVSGHAIHRIDGQEYRLDQSRPKSGAARAFSGGPYILSMTPLSSKKKILIAGHQTGRLIFYNLIGSKPTIIASTKVSDHAITTISVMENSELVFCGDNNGSIFALDMVDYAIDELETREANIYLSWRGHIDTITEIALIDHREILITSSLDCTCRAWTFDGEYVGTFGQNERWDLTESDTWKHPFTPDDVLVDPHTIPDVKTNDDTDNTSSDTSVRPTRWQTNIGKNFLQGKGDAEIINEVRETLKTSQGKRLKIQRQISKQPKDMRRDPASSAFRALKLHNLETEEEFTKPVKPKSNMDDYLFEMAKTVHYD